MRCCRNCRSAYGTCLTSHQCRCHRSAYREDHNGITYRDPTATEAINNIMRSQKNQQMK